MLHWIFLTVRKASVGLFVREHMETFRLFELRNVGQKFPKFSQKVKQNICDQAKRSNLIKTPSFPLLNIFCPI